MKKNQIKVGSKVVVVDSGRTYPTYSQKFEELGFRDTKKNEEIPEGTICEVFAIAQHSPGSETIVVAIEDQRGHQALIGLVGVKKLVEEEFTAEDKFDLLKDFCDELDLGITSEQIFKYLLRKLEKQLVD
jgi:hypothetical protein